MSKLTYFIINSSYVRRMKRNIIALLFTLLLTISCSDNTTEAIHANRFSGKWMLNIWDNQVEATISVNGNTMTFLKYPFSGYYTNPNSYQGVSKYRIERHELIITLVTADSISGSLASFVDTNNTQYTSMDYFTGIRIK